MSIIIRTLHNTTSLPITLEVPGYNTAKPTVSIPASTTVDLFTVLTGDELEAIQPLLAEFIAAGDFTVIATVDTTTFNPVGGGSGGITQLTGDVTAGPGSGSVAAIVASVGGSSSANVNSATAQILEGPSNILYVNQNQPGGATPDGSILRPFIHIMDAVNQIITNNNGLNYVINIAPGTYTESISLNNAALSRIAFVGAQVSDGALSAFDIPIVSVVGDVTSTSNNTNLKALVMTGIDLEGNIILNGDINNTNFGEYGFVFSNMTVDTQGSPGISLINVGNVIFQNMGIVNGAGSGAITVTNVVNFLTYSVFFNVGTLTTVTDGSANKPSGFGVTNVQLSYGSYLGPIIHGTGSTMAQRYERITSTINNAGTLTSVNSVFQGTVTNSGTWNSNADALNATPVNTGTINNNSTLYSSFAYTPAVPANWNVQPTTVKQALDAIAAKIGPI